MQGDREPATHRTVRYGTFSLKNSRIPLSWQLLLWLLLCCCQFRLAYWLRSIQMADTVCSTFSFVGLAMRNFWLGLLLIMLFSVNLHLLPSTGAVGVKSLILPAITCGTGTWVLRHITCSSMLDVLRQDYLRTARAKGQSEGKIITRHAFKNADILVVTQIGIQMSTLLGGAVLTERCIRLAGRGSVPGRFHLEK